MSAQNENQVVEMVSPTAISGDEALTPENLDHYENQGRRAIMWLSAYMKIWLRQYTLSESETGSLSQATLEEVEKKVTEKSPVGSIIQFVAFLNTFTDVTELKGKNTDEQLNRLSKFKAAHSTIESLGEKEAFEDFLALPAEGEVFDDQELQQLIREFRHDFKSDIENGLSFGLVDYRSNPFTHMFDHVKNIWKGIQDTQSVFYFSEAKDPAKDPERFAAHMVKEKTVNSIFSDKEIASMLLDVNHLLYAFNLEVGGGSDEPMPVEELLRYLDLRLFRLRRQFPNLIFSQKVEVVPNVGKRLSYLNIPAASRFLTNAVTNVARGESKTVEITCQVQENQVILEVDDAGAGFPVSAESGGTSEITEKSLLGKKVIPYKIELGKTSWKNAKGTGTGLYGLQRWVRDSLHGELIAGNRYGEHGFEGGTLAAVLPVFSQK